MRLREKEFCEACFYLAKNAMFIFGPVSTAKIAELGERLERVAARHVEFVRDCGHDPNIVTRAIWWVVETQSAAPADRAEEWLEDMLEALVELAVPKESLSPRAIGFLADIEQDTILVRDTE